MSSNTKYHINPHIPSTGGSTFDISFGQRINSDIVTNINAATLTEVPMDGKISVYQSGFAGAGNGIELTGEGGLVRCSATIHITSVVQRANIRIRLAKNGVLFGPAACSGYIRALRGHNESSISITPTWTRMAMGDVITVESIQEANVGTVTLAAEGTSILLLERIINV